MLNELLISIISIDVEFVEIYGELGMLLFGLSVIGVEFNDILLNGIIDF